MMVTFVSQCEKKALKRTRRVLDSFADRIGDNTWQTIITLEGLDAVKKLLRKTASKSTAVSCHWIRSRSHTELVWVVGNRDRFNDRGVVPVHYTQKSILENYHENDWKYLSLIKALTAVAALFHDWGKANNYFQKKLKPTDEKLIKADPLRHEWISCLLLHTFIKECEKDSKNWLECLKNGEIDEEAIKANLSQNIKNPFKDMPKLAQVVFWLILSHHKLPSASKNKNDLKNGWQGEKAKQIEDVLAFVNQGWGYENIGDDANQIKECFSFTQGLLTNSKAWLKEVKKWSVKLQNESVAFEESLADGSIRVLLHHARLSLMLGDHFYSSQNANPSWQERIELYANTDPKTKQLKQRLDEHIVGVQKSALIIAHSLTKFEHEPPKVEDIKVLQKSRLKAFDWQDKAVKVLRENYKHESGFFAVNMASTGCGKTIANAKIMQAISEDQKSLRYILALGLRTLTLQTGDEYREKIGLSNKELAVLIGSKAVLSLHNNTKNDKSNSEEDTFGGSESLESLFDEEIDSACDLPTEGLVTLINNKKDKQFLYAPVLACTIDHLMGAVETKRGGKYLLPSLRLCSSDLVIDEIDDFSGSDLIAIGRLVYLAAMLGRKVMISSATIPPDLAEGYFNIYKKGWELFAKTRDVKTSVLCAWIDEFSTKVHKVESNESVIKYREYHKIFIEKRIKKLSIQIAKRRVDIVLCKDEMDGCEFEDESVKQNSYFEIMTKAILAKHQHHYTIDMATNIKVSFGVVRVANIEPCISFGLYLQKQAPSKDIEFRVMSYHSRQILLLRHLQEKHLDEVLKRKEENGDEPKAFANETIRHHLDNTEAKIIIFVLVATPVEEVGRDHDFDWAVVEPSSYRSIIQLAGRVRRHRDGDVDMPNISLMQYNYKAFRANDKDGKYFNFPGPEGSVRLNTHDLKQLVDEATLSDRLDAAPRISKKEKLDEKNSLADLEHYVVGEDLTHYDSVGANSIHGFLDESWYLTAHPQIFHPFRESPEGVKLYFLYDEKKDEIYVAQKDDYGEFVNRTSIYPITISNDDNLQSLWLQRDYKKSLEQYVNIENKTKEEVSKVYGELSFIYTNGAEYRYSDQSGLVKV